MESRSPQLIAVASLKLNHLRIPADASHAISTANRCGLVEAASASTRDRSRPLRRSPQLIAVASLKPIPEGVLNELADGSPQLIAVASLKQPAPLTASVL